MSAPNSQKAEPDGEAEWFAWREDHRDYPPYEIWMAAFAAGRAAQSGPSEREAVLEEAARVCDEHEAHHKAQQEKMRGDDMYAFKGGARLAAGVCAAHIRALKNAAPQSATEDDGK